MACDVKAADVKSIITTEVSDADAEIFIRAAARLFADQLSGKSINVETEFEITRYLAAHFLSSSKDPEAGSLTEVSIDRYRTEMGGGSRTQFGPGLNQTRFGQMAMILDPTGTLAANADGNKPIGSFEVVELPDPDD